MGATYLPADQRIQHASAELRSLHISEVTKDGSFISQPNFLTPNVPVGTGSPTIAAGASVSYGFQVVSTAPVMPGQGMGLQIPGPPQPRQFVAPGVGQ